MRITYKAKCTRELHLEYINIIISNITAIFALVKIYSKILKTNRI